MTAVLVLLTCGGCGSGETIPQSTPDAGLLQPTGGGTGNTRVDGGVLDAGGPMVDAGMPDAGTPDRVTVSGFVITSYGQVVSSATVVILGEGSTTTDTSGRFSFTNVKTPYDIAVLSGVNSSATIYRGVTRTSPRVILWDNTETSAKSSSKLSATLTGDMLSQSATTSVFDSQAFVPDGKDDQADKLAPCSFGASVTITCDFTWWRGVSETGSMHVLEWAQDKTTLYPTDYRYGHTDGLTVANGSSSQFTLTMGAVDTKVLSLQTMVPEGATVDGLWLYLQFPNEETITFFSQLKNASSSLSVRVPRVPGASLGVEVRAKDNAGNVLHATKLGINVDQPEAIALPKLAPRLSLPIDQASGIDITTQNFSWVSIPESRVTLVTFRTPTLTIYEFTPGAKVQVPPTAELGLGTIPTGTTVTWGVEAYGGPDSTDRVLDPDYPTYATWQSSVGTSVSRTYTTR